MSACLETTSPTAPSNPTDAGAARLAKFKREQLIVEYLNRGVSVSEIAARVGVGEKRLRAVVRDILARRMPYPPAEFVAIQLSRLNEALLVAYSAMSPTNLKAVDQVVKIVRELDRYGGAFAAEWVRPEASARIVRGSRPGDLGLDAPVDEASALGVAWGCWAELASQAGDLNLVAERRPENSAQRLENIDSAPGSSPGREKGPVGARPENLPQPIEMIDSAPGIWSTPEGSANSGPEAGALPDCEAASPGLVLSPSACAGDDRPENLSQHLEIMESAPGHALTTEASGKADAAAGEPHAFARADLPPDPAPPGASPERRPGIPPQPVGKVDSAPGSGWLAEAAPAPVGTPVILPTVPNPSGVGFVTARMTLNGAMAC